MHWTIKNKSLSTTHKISLTGLMLSLVLFFHFFEKFVPLFAYVKLNFSLIFILPIFVLNGWSYGLVALLFRSLVGSILNGFTIYTLIAQMILLMIELFAIVLIIFFRYFLKFKILPTLLITIFLVSLIAALTNAMFFLPIYLYYFEMIESPTLEAILKFWEKNEILKYAFLGIDSYWIAVIVGSFLANLTKFTILFSLYLPLSRMIEQFYYRKN